MKVAIVHYWLTNYRGGEKVLEALCEMYPEADIYTHVYDPTKLNSPVIQQHNIRQTFISKLPLAKRFYQFYLPLMPLALEQLDLNDYDLVISSESGPAKGVITGPRTTHVCYCHSPMRYVWDMYHDYLKGSGWLKRQGARVFFHYLRLWDLASAARVDTFIANSSFVASRITKYYRRPSDIVTPPVDIGEFPLNPHRQGDFYLLVGELVAYKKADLAVDAFARAGRQLKVIGDGELLSRLTGFNHPNIEFLGRAPQNQLVEAYGNCRALIFPGLEDFGIVPVEAMATGAPIIAFGQGGILDSTIEHKSAVYFSEQSVDAINDAIADFEKNGVEFSSQEISDHAAKFTKSRFQTNVKLVVDKALNPSA